MIVRDYDALVAYLGERNAMPFAWGSQDCVLFAAGAVQAVTGLDRLADATARTWTDARTALEALDAHGGLEAAVDSVLERIPAGMAHRGDIGLLDLDGRPSLVVFEGEVIVGPGTDGLVRLPRGLVSVAWSVG